MKNIMKLFLLILSINLVACSAWDTMWDRKEPKNIANYSNDDETQLANSDNLSPPNMKLASNGPLGGHVARGMDGTDRSKFFHALDGGVGKSSHWINPTTGVSYTVVPTQKTSVSGNPYCRNYNISAESNGREKNSNGVACVDANGAWQEVTG